MKSFKRGLVKWLLTFSLLLTVSVADQDVSPLSDEAVQV